MRLGGQSGHPAAATSDLPATATAVAPDVVRSIPMTAVPEGARRRPRWPDVLGVLWTVAAAAAVLAPALRPGISLGPFDLLSRFGLTSQPGVTVHNAVQSDQIEQFVPWTYLAWHQVHGGHLPLWNIYNVLGMPLAFNWQSGVFSFPALVSYLFPVHYAYTVVVLVKLVAAGTGVYVLCRVFGLGPLAAAFGGTAFELSGPMVDHAGWPHTAVTCWAGWMLVAVVYLVRGRRRFASTVLLSLSVAFAVYGGHPESLVVTAVAVVVFLAVYLVARATHGGGPVLRPVRDFVVGSVCGAALAAPLLFPGVQLAAHSSRGSGTGAPAFPLSHATNLLTAGFQGADFRTAAYVGVVVLALAVVALRTAWARPAVPAMTVVAVLSALLTYFSPVDGLLHRLPGAKAVAWSRAVMLLALALAVLGAFGLQALVARPRGAAPADGTDPEGERSLPGAGDRHTLALAWAAGSFAALGLVVVALEVAGRTGSAPAVAHHQGSLVWPGAQALAGTVLTGAWWWSRRTSASRGRRGAHAAPRRADGARAGAWAALPALFLALETAFLLGTGIPYWSVSPTYFAPTAAIDEVRAIVGPSLVGFGRCRALRYNTASKAEVGIRANANIGYGLREMEVYDPIIPTSYYHEWFALTGRHTVPSFTQLGIFCPRISSVTEARVFGVRYVLEPKGRMGPAGTLLVRDVGGESVWFVPHSPSATANPVPHGAPLPTTAPGTPLALEAPSPGEERVTVDEPTASVVRLRLTAVPGWRGSIDGRPLALGTWAGGSMVQATVPAGRHVLVLTYWPAAFADGLVVAAVAVAGFVVVGLVVLLRRRRGGRRALPAT